MEEKLLRMKQVQEIVPFSRTKIYEMIKLQEFPKQLKLGGTSVWKKSEVLDFVKKISDSDVKTAS